MRRGSAAVIVSIDTEIVTAARTTDAGRAVVAPARKNQAVGDYLDLGGHRIYYEEYGAGEPLFLLHGGFVGADSWAAQVPELAKAYHVFVP
jgi:hypothetical protein